MTEAKFVDKELEKIKDANGRNWYVVQKGLSQVKKFLEDVGLPQYYDEFIRRGFCFGITITTISQYLLQTSFGIKDPQEIEAILAHSAEIAKDPDVLHWYERYGNPMDALEGCWQGREILTKNQKEEQKAMEFTTLADRFYNPPENEAYYRTDAQWVSGAGCDGFIFLWPMDDDRTKLGPARMANLHSFALCDFKMDWKGMRSISCGGDAKVTLYDWEKEAIIGNIKNNAAGVDVFGTMLAVDGDFDSGKVAIGFVKGPCKIGDMETGKIVVQMRANADSIYSVQADWDQHVVATASWDRTIRLSDIRTGKNTKVLSGHKQIINKMDVDFERQLVLSVGDEDDFFLWDLKEAAIVKKYNGHHGGNNNVSVDWASMRCCTGGEDGLCKKWDLETGECTMTIDCNHKQTIGLDVNWESGVIATASWDNQLKVWDLQTGALKKEMTHARRTYTTCHLKGGRFDYSK